LFKVVTVTQQKFLIGKNIKKAAILVQAFRFPAAK
jgi:hypothetical protein